jgi:tetratricopeptide (TPR) repeat protein
MAPALDHGDSDYSEESSSWGSEEELDVGHPSENATSGSGSDDEERIEPEDSDDDEERGYDIGRFLDHVDDIPTALAGLKGVSVDVAENMSVGTFLRRDKLRNISEKTRGAMRKTRSAVQAELADQGMLSSEEEYEEDEWDDAQAEAMGLTPAANRRAEKRRQTNKMKKIQQGKVIRDRSGMPEEAKDKLGSGTVKYVQGQYKEAEELFMSCIRLAPEFPDAYSSLSRLYEETGDMMKSMNFLIVAAYLTKKDPEIWKDAARKSKEQGALRQAVHCYNQVIRRDKDDCEWKLQRGLTLIEIGGNNQKKALEDLLEYSESYPDNERVIIEITRLHHQLGHLEDAVEAIRTFVQDYPEKVSLTHINILGELYMNLDQPEWDLILQLISRARDRYLPEGASDLPIDLTSKEAVALAHTGQVDRARKIAASFLEQGPVTDIADVYKLIAEKFKQLGLYEDSLPFFEQLASMPTSDVDIWANYAEVRGKTDPSSSHVSGAISAWKMIVEKVPRDNPNYIDAIIELSSKLLENGDKESALEYLDILNDIEPYGHEEWTIEEDTYLKRANVLLSCGRDDLYVRYFLEPTIKSLRMILLQAESSSRRKGAKIKADALPSLGDDLIVWESTQEKRRKKGNDLDIVGSDQLHLDEMADVPVFQNIVKDKKNFDTIVHLVKILLAMDNVSKALTVCDLIVSVLAKKHPNKERRDTMKTYLAECCCRMRDWSNALKHIKGPADTSDGSSSPLIWNIFTKIAIGVGGVRQTSKYISNMRKKYPLSLPIAILSGHVKLQSQDYGGALGEYLDAHRMNPSEAIVKLCISNLFANYACENKKSRDLALVHAFAWMQEYGRATSNPAEASYNAGRIAHQFCMHHLSVPLYRESLYHHDVLCAGIQLEASGVGPVAKFATLGTADTVENSSIEQHRDIIHGGLSREAAYNLSLILIESKAFELAREVRRRYLTF